MRHPCERWGYCPVRGKFVFLSAWEPSSYPHPDSKRQKINKRRDLERYGARVLKASGVQSCPVAKIDKRQDMKDMQRRLREEGKRLALAFSLRLQGKGHLLVGRNAPVVPVDAIALMAHIHQMAQDATGSSYVR